jgi:hypothetical protein
MVRQRDITFGSWVGIRVSPEERKHPSLNHLTRRPLTGREHLRIDRGWWGRL